jgi:hypothetical protein
MTGEAPSFAADVRPLFRSKDLRAMGSFFDLGSYEDVSERAEAIWERLEGGSMPCDAMWGEETVAVFRRWIDSGKAR